MAEQNVEEGRGIEKNGSARSISVDLRFRARSSPSLSWCIFLCFKKLKLYRSVILIPNTLNKNIGRLKETDWCWMKYIPLGESDHPKKNNFSSVCHFKSLPRKERAYFSDDIQDVKLPLHSFCVKFIWVDRARMMGYHVIKYNDKKVLFFLFFL